MARGTSTGSDSYGFESFFRAIAGQESGGNYGAINSRTGASGKYQIMPANIGPWSQQYLGRRVSVAQFRSSPQIQEELARAVLSDYYRKYGARGAAAAWYSGSAAKASDYKRFRSNEPSVGEYVDQVLARAGAAHGSANAAQPTPSAGSITQPVPGLDPLDSSPQGVSALNVQPDSLGRTTGAQTQQASALPSLGQTKGFDCSGLIQYVYGKLGIHLPRISAQQARYGTQVGLDQLQPGDLVAEDNSSRNYGADHIAIWLGNGQILEAPRAGLDVRVRSIGKNEGFYGVKLNI